VKDCAPLIGFCLMGFWLLVGCAGPPQLTAEQLQDPQECAPCHARAVAEWEGSMHAYASTDPVFRALLAKGQRETDGALGQLCITCHAPMVQRLDLSPDGLDLADLPDTVQGVGCAFCHLADDVLGLHNNQITLADDGVMRGAWDDPVPTSAHASAYSPFLDRNAPESSDLCGSCHDVVLPNGLHLEQTYLEWSESIFATSETAGLSCGQCHMRGRPGYGADVDEADARRLHDHSMPGVDIALDPFPRRAQQLELVQNELDHSLLAVLQPYLAPGGLAVDVTLENVAAGHGFPSGAAHNRRVWVELEAFVGRHRVYASGSVPAGEPVLGRDDEDLWVLRDRIYGADGQEVQHAWEAVTLEKDQLRPGMTADPTNPEYVHSQTRTYLIEGVVPDRVRMAVHIRPFGEDILQTLVDSGDLDPAHRAMNPTFTLESTVKEWTSD